MNTENKANIEEKIEESVEKARQMMRQGTDKLEEMAKSRLVSRMNILKIFFRVKIG